jgi:hypothetical protein
MGEQDGHCMLQQKITYLKNNFLEYFLSLCMEMEGLSKSESLQMRGKL